MKKRVTPPTQVTHAALELGIGGMFLSSKGIMEEGRRLAINSPAHTLPSEENGHIHCDNETHVLTRSEAKTENSAMLSSRLVEVENTTGRNLRDQPYEPSKTSWIVLASISNTTNIHRDN